MTAVAHDPATLAPRPRRAALVLAFGAIYLVWGGTFLAVRYAVAAVPPLVTIAIRCIAGAVLFALWAIARRELTRPTAAQWWTALVAGTLLFLGCHAVLAWAEQRVTSGQAALCMTSIPMWTVILSALRERRLPSWRAAVGLILGVGGVALLVAGGTGTLSPRDAGALVLCGLAWALGALVARDGARVDSTVQWTAMQLAAGGAVVLCGAALAGELETWAPSALTARGAGALVFLVLGGTVAGFGAYTWLMRTVSAASVGTYAFVNPLVAVALAWAVGDEAASGRTAVAALLVVAAVALSWERGPARAGR